MGLAPSFMGRGLPKKQMLSLVMGALYSSFLKEDITSFEKFHIAIIDIFATINSALPGKHYDVPSRHEVEEWYKKWMEADDKKQVFVEFMTNNVKGSKLDDSTLITGLLTPPAAMAVKKTGENIPQLKFIKVVPDVLFVPSATVLVLISVKISRKLFFSKMAEHEHQDDELTQHDQLDEHDHLDQHYQPRA